MREKGWEFGGKVGGAEPSVEPEGGRAPVADDNRGDVSEMGELLMKDAIQKRDRHVVAPRSEVVCHWTQDFQGRESGPRNL